MAIEAYFAGMSCDKLLSKVSFGSTAIAASPLKQQGSSSLDRHTVAMLLKIAA